MRDAEDKRSSRENTMATLRLPALGLASALASGCSLFVSVPDRPEPAGALGCDTPHATAIVDTVVAGSALVLTGFLAWRAHEAPPDPQHSCYEFCGFGEAAKYQVGMVFSVPITVIAAMSATSGWSKWSRCRRMLIEPDAFPPQGRQAFAEWLSHRMSARSRAITATTTGPDASILLLEGPGCRNGLDSAFTILQSEGLLAKAQEEGFTSIQCRQ
jgi:hypothetical protein